MCPRKVRDMSSLAMYSLPGEGTLGTARAATGCSICRWFGDQGGRLSGRQALGRGELEISNKINHPKEVVDNHVRRSSGDHGKALAALRRQHGGGAGAEEAGAKKRRVPETSTEEQNTVFLAYNSFTMRQYAALGHMSYSLGADLPDAHFSSRCFAEVASPVLAVAAHKGSAGTGYFVIRVTFLTALPLGAAHNRRYYTHRI